MDKKLATLSKKLEGMDETSNSDMETQFERPDQSDESNTMDVDSFQQISDQQSNAMDIDIDTNFVENNRSEIQELAVSSLSNHFLKISTQFEKFAESCINLVSIRADPILSDKIACSCKSRASQILDWVLTLKQRSAFDNYLTLRGRS